MTRVEFLRKIELGLYKLPQNERDEALEYYIEYFDEAGEENEQAVIEELGSPARIATQIKADYATRQFADDEFNGKSKKQKKEPGTASKVWWIILGIFGGICAAPIAIPLAIALISVLVAVLLTIFAVLLALALTIGACFISGILLLIFGVGIFAVSASSGILTIGLGLMSIAVMGIAGLGLIKLTQLIIRFIARKIGERKQRNTDRKLLKEDRGEIDE